MLAITTGSKYTNNRRKEVESEHIRSDQNISGCPSDFSTHETSDEDNSVIPRDTGTIVECYENPEGYAVDIAIPMKG
jgi:hypothetical protein